MRRVLAALLASTAVFSTPSARAQQYVLGASAELLGGAEGGGALAPLRRSRSTLRVGGDVRVDERPKDVLSAAALLELEPTTAVGVDARYVRLAGRFAFGAGGIGYLAPATLFGGTADLIYRHPLSSVTAFTVGPALNVFFLGGDLPDDTVMWQAVLRVGFRADL